MASLKNAAKLRRETNLKPITRNTTHWSSLFAMVERYSKLVPILEKTFAFSEFTDEMLTPSENLQSSNLLAELKDFN